MAQCLSCEGTGWYTGACKHCDGRRWVGCPNCEGLGVPSCSLCQGRGRYECLWCTTGEQDYQCSFCGGTGVIPDENVTQRERAAKQETKPENAIARSVTETITVIQPPTKGRFIPNGNFYRLVALFVTAGGACFYFFPKLNRSNSAPALSTGTSLHQPQAQGVLTAKPSTIQIRSPQRDPETATKPITKHQTTHKPTHKHQPTGVAAIRHQPTQPKIEEPPKPRIKHPDDPPIHDGGDG